MDYGAVGVDNVNATNTAEYEKTDLETLWGIQGHQFGLPLGSLETTHGLIRVIGARRFQFILGIANRIGRFTTKSSQGSTHRTAQVPTMRV